MARGRKPLPIHDTAMRDIQSMVLLNKRIQEVDSKYISEEDRVRVKEAAQTIVDVLNSAHKAYWGE